MPIKKTKYIKTVNSSNRKLKSLKYNLCNFTEPNYCQSKDSGGRQNTIFSIDKDKCAKKIKLEDPEIKFYKKYNELRLKVLQDYIPKYFEICEKDNSHYVVLENLKNGFNKPLTIDIKFGFTTSMKKIMDIQKYSLFSKQIKTIRHFFLDKVLSSSSKLGFRIEGANLNKRLTKKKLMCQNVFKTLQSYFSSDKNNYAINSFITKLKEFLTRISNDTEFQKILFMGSSILFTYDGIEPSNTSFKIIDFNNTIILDNQSEIDKNKNHSLNTIKAFTNLLTTLEKFRDSKYLHSK